MATLFECPAVEVPTANVVNVSNDAQLAQAISMRENGFGQPNIVASGSFREHWVDGANGCHIWLTAGSTMQYQGGNGVPGGAVMRFRNCTDFGLHGEHAGGLPENLNLLDVDGNSNGNNGAVWGVVVGNSFLGDPNAGACQNGVVEGVRVHHVRQELVKVAQTGTQDVSVLCNELHNSGQNSNGNPFGEGVYCGQGNATEFLERILIQGNYIHDCFFGEAIDVKRGSSDVFVLDNLCLDNELPFAGAITFWVDDTSGGTTGNSIIARNRIGRTGPAAGAFTQVIEAIEVGGAVLIENNVLWDFTGRGINMVRQFADNEKLVRAYHNTIDASGAQAAFGINVEAPNGGNNPGQLETCGNLYVGSHFQGIATSSMQDQSYQAGFVGAPGANGAGYELSPNTVHVDAAPTCPTSNDICDNGRPQNGQSDYGAFEVTVDLALEPDFYTGPVGGAFNLNLLTNDPSGGSLSQSGATCQIISGSLPPGTAFQSPGSVTGTPTQAGTYNVTYQCTDPSGNTAQSTAEFVIVAPEVSGIRFVVVG